MFFPYQKLPKASDLKNNMTKNSLKSQFNTHGFKQLIYCLIMDSSTF